MQLVGGDVVVGDQGIADRDAVVLDHGVADGHATARAQVDVLGQVEGQVRAVALDHDVAVGAAEVHRAARADIRAGTAVRAHVPALRGLCDRIVDGGRARTADAVGIATHGDVAIDIHGRIATQHAHQAVGDVADCHLRREQLRTVDRIGAGIVDAAGGHVGDGALGARAADTDRGTGIGTCKATVSDATHRCIFGTHRHVGERSTAEGHVVGMIGHCSAAYGHRRGSVVRDLRQGPYRRGEGCTNPCRRICTKRRAVVILGRGHVADRRGIVVAGRVGARGHRAITHGDRAATGRIGRAQRDVVGLACRGTGNGSRGGIRANCHVPQLASRGHVTQRS